MPTRQQNKQRARQAIVDAAVSLIAQFGVDKTTTRQIADAACVSYQTLYNYFPSKAAILHTIVGKGAGAFGIQIDGIIKQYNGDLVRRLGLINRLHLQYIDSTDVTLWRAIGNIQEAPAPDLLQVIDNARHERYYTILRMAQGIGDLSSDIDLHVMSHTLHVLAQYMVSRYVLDPEAELEPLLRTLHEQTAQLIEPYLTPRTKNVFIQGSRSDATNATHVSKD
jgi:AcrR family transcriptional regulator